VPFDISGKTGYVIDQNPEAGSPLNKGQKISLTLSETYAEADSASIKEGYAEIPELKGMNMRSAMALLSELELNSEIIGSGTVFAQYPKAGELLRKGYTVTLRGKAKSLEILTQVSDR
jgi:beta-lactam-binding protein with PASTA domain